MKRARASLSPPVSRLSAERSEEKSQSVPSPKVPKVPKVPERDEAAKERELRAIDLRLKRVQKAEQRKLVQRAFKEWARARDISIDRTRLRMKRAARHHSRALARRWLLRWKDEGTNMRQ